MEKFTEEVALLQKFCSEHGMTYEPGNPGAPDYVLARLTGEGLVIVAYPHKTSAGNHHIRLRDGGSKDKNACAMTMYAIYNSKPYVHNCTFQHKNFDHNKALQLLRKGK